MSKKTTRGLSEMTDRPAIDGANSDPVPASQSSALPLHATYLTSYSANCEDVILHRIFGGKPNGFYVDVGAAHPLFENDTKLFYDRGWTGINVEPNTSFFELLASERPRDRNFRLAVSELAGDVDFYEVVGTGLSTCDENQAAIARRKGHQVVKQTVASATLGSILDQVAPPTIDFLKVDVEGFEQQVLSSNDWDKYRPSIIFLEVTLPETPTRRVTKVRAYLEQRGYSWRYFDGLNDFYVAEEFEVAGDVFDRPPNVFDGFKSRMMVDLEQQVTNLAAAHQQTKAYAQSLEQTMAKAEAYSHSLEPAIAKAESYAKSLEQALAKAEAYSQGLQTAATKAESYAKGLEQALAETEQKTREEVQSLKASNDIARQYSEDLSQNLQVLRDEYSILQMANNRVRIELANQTFERHTALVVADKMRKELIDLHRELERWIADRGEMLYLRAVQVQESARHAAEIQQLRQRLSEESDQQRQAYGAELLQLRARLADVEAGRQAVLASSSWRITRAYRAIGMALNALKRDVS